MSLQGLPNTTNPQNDFHVVTVADFNSDGIQDILWSNYANAVNAIWLMNGTGSPSTVVNLLSLPASFRLQAAGDLNGDAKPDIFIRDFSTGKNYAWVMDGTSLVTTVNLPGLPNVDLSSAASATSTSTVNPTFSGATRTPRRATRARTRSGS